MDSVRARVVVRAAREGTSRGHGIPVLDRPSIDLRPTFGRRSTARAEVGDPRTRPEARRACMRGPGAGRRVARGADQRAVWACVLAGAIEAFEAIQWGHSLDHRGGTDAMDVMDVKDIMDAMDAMGVMDLEGLGTDPEQGIGDDRTDRVPPVLSFRGRSGIDDGSVGGPARPIKTWSRKSGTGPSHE